jgi:hypothetical protein
LKPQYNKYTFSEVWHIPRNYRVLNNKKEGSGGTKGYYKVQKRKVAQDKTKRKAVRVLKGTTEYRRGKWHRTRQNGRQ